jgi:ABC-type sugar transport system ATPase subunit
MASIRMRGLVKRYGDVTVVPALDLRSATRSSSCSSGCGTSTLLSVIAGLEPIDAGELYIGDVRVNAKLRGEVRTEIKALSQQLKTTVVFVTHDQVEAMTMADRIVVLKDGVVQQFVTPEEIYKTPANQFVAGFIGSPTMNFFNAEAVAGGVQLEGGAVFARRDP